MTRIGSLALVTVFAGALPAGAYASPFESASVLPDAQLSVLRGGVLLPNGLDVAVGIDIQTLVDGRLALHTVLSTQDPAPNRLRVLVGDRPDPMVTGRTFMKPAAVAPELVFDRKGAGPTLLVSRASSGMGSPSVNVLSAPREVWPSYPGETEVAPVSGGAAVATPLGAVTLSESPSGNVVTLSGDALRIQHWVGQATGVIVANAANDRSIESVSTIDVDLKGAWVPVANGVFSVNAIAADAVARR